MSSWKDEVLSAKMGRLWEVRSRAGRGGAGVPFQTCRIEMSQNSDGQLGTQVWGFQRQFKCLGLEAHTISRAY